MQSTRTAVVAVLLSALVAPAARAAHAQNPKDPCAQITAAEVSTSLGETVAPGTQSGLVTCSWVANKPTHQVVSLMYWKPGDWDSLRNRQVVGVTKEPVSGVGDDAVTQTVGTFRSLFVKKGNVVFMVRVYGVPDPTKQLAIEKPIAQTIASKL